MAHHQLFEWEARRFDADDRIPVAEAEALVRAAATPAARLTGAQRAFEFRRDALVAQNLVGIVVAGTASCEILPKVDRDAPANVPGLRRQLIRMLGVAHDLPIADDAATSLDTQTDTLLEILIARFAALLREAVRRGMPRAYVAHADDLPALRGRLDATRQFTTLAASPQRLACRYDDFSADIALNQVIKAAVTRLRGLARTHANARALAELALLYDEVSPVPPRGLRWDAIAPDRGNARWQGLVRLARLILGDRFQSSAHGAADGFALLFDMNVLFERYVARLLAPIAAAHGWQVTAQGGKRACLFPEGVVGGLFATEPDLLLTRGPETLVIDTKWKRLGDPSAGAGAKRDVAQADVYQLMAYAQVYDAQALVLLYPHHAGLIAPLPLHTRIARAGGPVRLSFATVDCASHASARASLAALLAGTAAAEQAA